MGNRKMKEYGMTVNRMYKYLYEFANKQIQLVKNTKRK